MIRSSVRRNDPGELIPTERVALVAVDLALGGTVTTTFLAAQLGISRSGAWRMLTGLSRVAYHIRRRRALVLVDSQSTGPR